MDLLHFKDLSIIIGTLVGSITAIVGSIMAYKGLNTWKRQLNGNFEYAFCIRILKHVYSIRRKIDTFRFPFYISNLDINTPPDELSYKSYLKKMEEQWKPISDLYEEFQVCLIEAEVLWGNTPLNICKDFIDCITELNTTNYFIIAAEHPDKKEKVIFSKDERKKYNNIVYSKSDKTKDLFYEKLQTSILKIESYFKEKLGNKNTFFII